MRDDMICGQGRKPYREIPYGRSTVGKAGCEAIAAYNALRLLGRDVTFDEVLSAFVRLVRRPFRGWCMGGAFGAQPRDIAAFLRGRGVPFRRFRRLKTLKKSLAPGIYILSFWNKPIRYGYHTVAVEYDGARFTVYNVTNLSAAPVTVDTLEEILPGKHRLLCAFGVK